MNKNITPSLVKKLFPKRSDLSHKGSFGKIIVCGGSYPMIGAPYLSAISALRSGCGVVYIFTPKLVKGMISPIIPEAIVFAGKGKEGFIDKDSGVFLEIVEKLKPDLILFGPGMGLHPLTVRFLVDVVEKIDTPLVIDADGLNIFSQTGSFSLLKGKLSILTPHKGEATRFFKIDDIEKLALKISQETNSIVVLKDFKTIITDGKEIYIFKKPNSALSKAGSGDVLAGIISGIWVQKGKREGFNKKTAVDSSLCGVYIHSLSGKIVRKEKTSYGVISSDLVEAIPRAIKSIL